jgi:hypothetical protein
MATWEDVQKELEAHQAKVLEVPTPPPVVGKAPETEAPTRETTLTGLAKSALEFVGLGEEEKPYTDVSDLRKAFEFSPIQYELQAWDKEKTRIAQQYGGAARLNLDPQTNQPKSFTVEEKRLGGAGVPRDVTPSDDMWLDIDDYRQRQEDIVEALQDEEAVAAWPRLKKELKYTPEGKFQFLQSEFGKENVIPVFGADNKLDNIIVIEKGKEKLLDKDSAEWADLVEATPDMLKVGVSLAAGYLGGRAGPAGRVAAEAAADIGADIAHQAISEALPGEDFPEEMDARQEVLERAKGAGLYAAGGAGASAIAGGLKLLSPTGYVGRKIGKEAVPTTHKELMAGGGVTGRELAERIDPAARGLGVPLDVAQRTATPFAATTKKALSALPGGFEVFGHAERLQLERLADAVDNVAEKVASGKRVGAVAATQKLGEVYSNLRGGIVDAMRARAKPLFEAAEAVVEKDIPLNAFRAELDGLLATHEAVARSGQVKTLLGFAKKHIAEIEKAGGVASPIQIQNMLADYGKRAAGKGSLAKGLNMSESMHLASTLKKALDRDLDRAVSSGMKGADVLRRARDLWRQMYKQLDEAKNSVLEKALKLEDAGNPGALINKLSSPAFSPNELKRAMDTVQSVAPETARQVRGALIDNLAEPARKGVEVASLDAGKFADLFATNKKRLEAIFTGDPNGFRQLKNAATVAERIAGKGVMGGAKPNPLFTSLLMLGVKSTATLANIVTLGRTGSLTSWLAKAFVNPEARGILMGPPPGAVRKAGKWSADLMNAYLGRAAAAVARDEYLFPKEDVAEQPSAWSAPLNKEALENAMQLLRK